MVEKGTKRSLEINDSNEMFFDIGKNKRLTVKKFKNMKLVDIREFYEIEGELKPGKKGISLTEDQWNSIIENFKEIQEALNSLDEIQTVKKVKAIKLENSINEEE